MGLDMYLEAEVYIGGWEHMRKSEDPATRMEASKFDSVAAIILDTTADEYREQYPESDYLKVRFEVAYWRKANQIHAWFVKNVQDGVDECQYSNVSRKQLEELLTVCKEVFATVSGYDNPIVTKNEHFDTYDWPDLKLDETLANEKLPSQAGFFFGSTEMGSWYVRGIEDTIKQLEVILNDPRFKFANFYYHSSW